MFNTIDKITSHDILLSYFCSLETSLFRLICEEERRHNNKAPVVLLLVQ